MKATGQIKVASARIGCTVEVYMVNRAKGLSWCSGCRQWQPFIKSFRMCRPCSAKYSRQRYAKLGRNREVNEVPDRRFLVVGDGRFVYKSFAREKDAEVEARCLRLHLDNPPVIEVRQLR